MKTIVNVANNTVEQKELTSEEISSLNSLRVEQEQEQTEYDAQEYARNRKGEYPDIGDQLDDLFKQGAFSDEMTATLQAVKDKYPKE